MKQEHFMIEVFGIVILVGGTLFTSYYMVDPQSDYIIQSGFIVMVLGCLFIAYGYMKGNKHCQ